MGLRGPNTWGVRTVDESRAEQMLNTVLDSGINFIDTSPDYGVCEERIGRYISQRRGEYYLATKCGCAPVQHNDHLEIRHTWTVDTVRRNIETSLKRMQTDYVDLLQFHGGEAKTLQSEGLIDVLQELKSEGIVKNIGVSSKLPSIDAMVELDVFDSYQVPYSCIAPEHEAVIQRCVGSGAGVIVRGGIAQGGPDAEIQRANVNDVWAAAQLDELLPNGMSRAELILRYTVGNSNCHTTIVGTCNEDHLRQNIASATQGPLPQELHEEIRDRVRTAILGSG